MPQFPGRALLSILGSLLHVVLYLISLRHVLLASFHLPDLLLVAVRSTWDFIKFLDSVYILCFQE